MSVPQDMKALNEQIIKEHRANRGKLSGPLAGSQILLLTTTGARTGRLRTTVVGYRRSGDRYLAIASDNGNDVAPKWFGNLMKHPVATIEVGPDKLQVSARVATAEERPAFAKLIDYLERQQALTSREIPVVVLEPM